VTAHIGPMRQMSATTSKLRATLPYLRGEQPSNRRQLGAEAEGFDPVRIPDIMKVTHRNLCEVCKPDRFDTNWRLLLLVYCANNTLQNSTFRL